MQGILVLILKLHLSNVVITATIKDAFLKIGLMPEKKKRSWVSVTEDLDAQPEVLSITEQV